MFDAQPSDLNSNQVRALALLVHAGFRFVTFERYARYPAVEREGFVALLDVSGGNVRLFGQVGYHVGGGIGMLVERGQEQAFVWKDQSVIATPELLAAYERIKLDLRRLLNGSAGESS
jgi:hypothetical protein